MFEEYRQLGERMGYRAVFSGPFVRIWYMAGAGGGAPRVFLSRTLVSQLLCAQVLWAAVFPPLEGFFKPNPRSARGFCFCAFPDCCED